MKTTVDIDDELLRAAKRAAIDRHCTLRELIEGGLRRELAPPPAPAGGIQWVTGTGRWPQGVNLDDREAMWNWIDSEPKSQAAPSAGAR